MDTPLPIQLPPPGQAVRRVNLTLPPRTYERLARLASERREKVTTTATELVQAALDSLGA